MPTKSGQLRKATKSIQRPLIAQERSDDYRAAVLRELNRRIDSGDPLKLSDILANSTYLGSRWYPDGQPVNRTTIYAKTADGRGRVHEEIFTAIKQATAVRKIEAKHPSRSRSAAEDAREISQLKAREKKFANHLLEARTAERKAIELAEASERSKKKLSADRYLMCKIISLLSKERHPRIRSIIESFESSTDQRTKAALTAESLVIYKEMLVRTQVRRA